MRWLLIFLLTGLAWAEPLVTLVGRGGLTPKGGGYSELRIQPNGKFEWYDQMDDERLGFTGQTGNPKGFKGWYSTHLSAQDLSLLKKTIKSTDYKAWTMQDSRRTPPSAADGGDYTLTVGKRSLHLWQIPESRKIPLADLVWNLRDTYQIKGKRP